jgi:hypothetical protein
MPQCTPAVPIPNHSQPPVVFLFKKKRLIHSKASHGHLFQLGTWRIDAFFVTKQNQSAAPCLNSHPSLPPFYFSLGSKLAFRIHQSIWQAPRNKKT